jgi:hypothetical protein
MLGGAPSKRPFFAHAEITPGAAIPEYTVWFPNWEGWPNEIGEDDYDWGELRLFNIEGICETKNPDNLVPLKYRAVPTATVANSVDYRVDLWAAGIFVSVSISSSATQLLNH